MILFGKEMAIIVDSNSVLFKDNDMAWIVFSQEDYIQFVSNCIGYNIVLEVEPSGCGKCDPWSSHLLDEAGDMGETCQSIGCDKLNSSYGDFDALIDPKMILPICTESDGHRGDTAHVCHYKDFDGSQSFYPMPNGDDTVPPEQFPVNATPGMIALYVHLQKV